MIPKAGDLPPPPPCADAGCAPGTDDSTFRVVTIPHDFVVEGNFSKAADMSHGYLPYGVAYYRRHFALPADARQTDTFLFEFEGVMVHSQVWLNGVGIAAHDSGYTSFTAVVPGSVFKFGGADNVLALRVDATNPE